MVLSEGVVLSETATHSGSGSGSGNRNRSRSRNRKVEGTGGAKFNTAGAVGGE